MSNAANNLALAALIAAVALTGCKSESARRAERAEALRLEAETLASSGDYEQSIALLDSLDRTYHEQTDARRRALANRATAIEGLTLKKIAPADSLMALSQLRADSLATLFTWVEGPMGLEGHYVANELKGHDVTDATGIEPRVDPDGYLSIAAVVKGRSIGMNSLSLTTAAGNTRSAKADPSRVLNSEGSELTSFRQEDVSDLMQALVAAGDGPVALHIDGDKGSVEVKLTPALRDALVRSWQLAQARQQLRSAQIERERLERTLQTARNHKANA
ncbi:MAG: hypothetical protein K2M12_10240 [Muribaculaceae bacterium]|nr:hypothetical protein [Muribaculaceae bacterium]